MFLDKIKDFERTSETSTMNVENDDETSTGTKQEDSIDTAVEIGDLDVLTDLTFEQTVQFLDNQIDEFERNKETRESLAAGNETSEKIESEDDSDNPNKQELETDRDIDEKSCEEMEGDEKTDVVNEDPTSATYENLFNRNVDQYKETKSFSSPRNETPGTL